MKLLFLNQYFYPDEAATAQILGDLVEQVREAGIECAVVASNRSYANPEVTYPRHEVWRGAEISRIRMTGFGRSSRLGRLTDYVTFVLGAGLAALKTDSEIVIGLSTPPILGAVGAGVARLRGRRSVYWAMDVYPDLAFELGILSRRGIAGRVLEAISRWTLKTSDLVIALGETMALRLRASGASNVVVIHNWASEAGICPMPVEDSKFRQHGPWAGKFVVLYSGNLGLAHEFETVLVAAREMKDDPSIRFVFAGTGPRRAEVEETVRKWGLPNVSFHPSVPRDELGDFLAAGDLHLVTLADGLSGLLVPSKTYGILAAGRPILYVGPGEGEVHDIVTGFECGESTRNGDVKGVCETIRRYRDQADLRLRRGMAAREAFEENFTKERQTSKILTVLSALEKT